MILGVSLFPFAMLGYDNHTRSQCTVAAIQSKMSADDIAKICGKNR